MLAYDTVWCGRIGHAFTDRQSTTNRRHIPVYSYSLIQNYLGDLSSLSRSGNGVQSTRRGDATSSLFAFSKPNQQIVNIVYKVKTPRQQWHACIMQIPINAAR